MFASAIEIPIGVKVFEFFKSVLFTKAFHNSQQQHSQQQDVLDEELKKAYKLMNISPIAIDADVRRARNNAIKAVHPHISGLNQETCNQLTAEINNAYELVIKSRTKSKAKPA